MNLRAILLLGTLAAVWFGCGGDSIEKLRADGKKYYEQGNYEEARKRFVKALAEKPSDQDLLFYAGLAYQKDYMYDSAIYYFKRADLMNPNNREINEEIYDVANKLADYPNAIAAINVLAETGDGYDKYFEELSYLYDKDDKPGQSFYWARKAVVRGTDDPEIYMMAAGRAADYDSIAVALGMLDSAMIKWPDDPRFPGMKALVLFHDGKYTQAEMILRPLAEQSPPGMENYRLSLAQVLASQNSKAKKKEALGILEKIQPVMPPGSDVDTMIAELRRQLKE